MLPAFRGTRVRGRRIAEAAGRGVGRAEGGRRGLLVGKALVAAQMAFCLLLLVVAGLFTRSLQSLTQTDVGFDRDRVLTARVDVRGAGYTPDERLALYRRLIERSQALPGRAGGRASRRNGPLGNSQRISSLSVEGYTPGRDERLRTNEESRHRSVLRDDGTAAFSKAAASRAEDRAPGSRNTIVNATMAKRFFPGQSAIGKRWDYGDPIGKDSHVIVGVVEDARYVELRVRAAEHGLPRWPTSRPDDVLRDIEVRTAGAPGALAQTRARDAGAGRAAPADRRSRAARRSHRARRDRRTAWSRG